MVLRPPLGLGDYVQTVRHGLRGRVFRLHWSCPEADPVWRRMQVGVAAGQFAGERWVSVLVHEGDAVLVPASDVTPVEVFRFRNRRAKEFFPE